MILADSNFWLALSVSGHPFHSAANEWFAKQSSRNQVVFCRSTQNSLLRSLTTDAVMRGNGTIALTNAEAWLHYQRLSSHRAIGFIAEPAELESRWRQYSSRATASPKIWMDAYLAAFAVTAGLQLLSADRAFTHYESLDLILLKKN